MTARARLRRIRIVLAVFVAGLVVSGLTAFPLVSEARLLARVVGVSEVRDPAAAGGPAAAWVVVVRNGLEETAARHRFLFYGTDWLAFAHLVIAVAFVGPIRDPVRNRWVLEWGLIACAGIVPLALIAGTLRGIPGWWQLLDCSFGVFGAIPLLLARRDALALERLRPPDVLR